MSADPFLDSRAPADLDAERAVIGVCLAARRVLDEVAGLSPDDFYRPLHAAVWRAMLHDTCDPVILADRLAAPEYNRPQPIGMFLHGCIEASPVAGNADFYASIIRDKAGKRRIAEEAARILSSVASDDGTFADLLEHAERTLGRLQLGRADDDPVDTLMPLHEFLGETLPAPDWLIPGLLCRTERLMLTGAEGLGKGLELSTPLPTPTGWTTMGAIRVGEQLLDSAGRPCTVTGLSGHYRPDTLYRVRFSDGSELLADGPHQWVTWSLKARAARSAPSVVTTREIRDTLYARAGHTLNHAVRVAGPLDLPTSTLPIPPYTLGVWLGDGGTADGYLHLATRDLSILRGVEADGYEWHVSPSGDRQETCKRVTVRGFRAALRSVGMLGHKTIPAIYLRASLRQRLALLRGLMDTDGYISRGAETTGRGHGAAACELTLTNKALAFDALELVRSLGVKATIRESEATIAGVGKGPKWRITFQSQINPFLHAAFKRSRWQPLRTARATFRYITAVDEIEPRTVQCVQVDSPDQTYLAGEEMIPTHNTTLMRQLAICAAAGADPFNGKTVDPVTVLCLDFENPPHITQKRWHELNQALLAHQRPVDPGRLWLDRRPQGVDLSQSADRRWIRRRVQAVKPDLLVVGPVYKMMMGQMSEDKDEVIARTVQSLVDELRADFDCGVILEHHAGNGETAGRRDLRPFGSSLWRRWVDFGYGIRELDNAANTMARRLVEFKVWKYPRDPRAWPARLESLWSEHSRDWMPWVEAMG